MSDFWVALGRCCSDGQFLEGVRSRLFPNATNMNQLEELYNYLWDVADPAQPIPPDESAIGRQPYRLSRDNLLELNRIVHELEGKDNGAPRGPIRKIQAVWNIGQSRVVWLVFGLACIDEKFREKVSGLSAAQLGEELKRNPPRVDVSIVDLEELKDFISTDAAGKTVLERMVEIEELGWVIGQCRVGSRLKDFPHANPVTVNRMMRILAFREILEKAHKDDAKLIGRFQAAVNSGVDLVRS